MVEVMEIVYNVVKITFTFGSLMIKLYNLKWSAFPKIKKFQTAISS
jgi:hypothetical protein